VVLRPNGPMIVAVSLLYSIEVADDINTLGQLTYAVWLDSSASNVVPNCDHNPLWENMSQEEQNRWMRVGEMLFEQGRRWVLETVVKELYAVTNRSQSNSSEN
jgi:hypothetical protein